MSLIHLFLVAIGGALGAVSRFWVTRWWSGYAPHFPYPTLFLNLAGSALLGTLFALVEPELTALIDAPLLLFAGVGYCGALTTFSSFCTETVSLLANSILRAAVYVVCTVVGCVAAFGVPFYLL